MKKAKDNLKKFFLNTLTFIKENKLLFYFIIGCVINGTILRFLTVKNYFGISPILSDLFISILFGSLSLFIKEKNRFKYLFTLTIIFTIIGIANIVYYSYYDSFISITFISFALTNIDTGDSNVVGNLLKIEYFVLLWFPIFIFFINRYLNKQNKIIINFKKMSKKQSTRLVYTWFLIILLLFLSTLDIIDYGRLYNQWNREYSVTKFGVYLYQLNDIIGSVEPKIAPLFGRDIAKKKITNYYENEFNNSNINKYTNLLKDKNIIAIHAESIQQPVMDLSFNDIPVTPNLNKLAKEGIYFNNFYSQVSIGTSSDTEFTVATSLMPVKSGTAFINYFDRHFMSMYDILNDNGYYTFSMHANTGDFWNRNNMYKTLGYQYFYDKQYYNIDEKIGFGLSDKSFFTQVVDKLVEISNTKGKFYGTIITLSNHTPFEDIDKYGTYDVNKTIDGVNYPYMEETKLGNYFKSVHYADRQIGMFIDLLDEKGLLENTAIVIYGDHDARIAKSEWEYLYNYDYEKNSILNSDDENYQQLDYYWYETNRKVPFIIWTKDQEFQNNYSQIVDTVGGMIDVSPTILNLLGLSNPYALGNDLFSKKDNIVVFPNGNFITDKVYYNDSKNEYKILKDMPLDEEYIIKCKAYTENILDISNDITVYDYFEDILSNNKYVDERKKGDK